jgi:thiol-disulfide isomerase/thioredoxin
MKFRFKHLFLLIFVYFLFGCHEKDYSSTIRIKIVARDQRNETAKITSYKNLDEQILFDEKIDSSGNTSFSTRLSKPTFATFQLGNKYSEVYLVPGYDIIATTADTNRTIQFKGEGSEVNNYLSSVFTLVEDVKMANGKFIGQLGLDDFNKRFDSLSFLITSLHKTYIDSVQLSRKEVELLNQKNKIKLLTIRQEYAFSMYNNYLYENRDVLQNGKNIIEYKMPVGFENVAQEVPFDTALLNLGMFEYTYLCQLYLYNSIYNPNSCIGTKSAATPSDEVKSDSDIKQRTYPDGFQEYLLAKNIQYWLTMQGITSGIDSILDDFKLKYEKSVYLNAIQNEYNEWLAIAPGSPAPIFFGTTTSGKPFSSQEIKGKVIYIDVWATWCGPCIEEIPKAKKLYASFNNDSQIEFVNVSIDRDIEAWRKFLHENQDWKGTHINQQDEQVESFWKSYKMAGVPTYILIDQKGKIVNASAKRPSDENIKSQIQQLLQIDP